MISCQADANIRVNLTETMLKYLANGNMAHIFYTLMHIMNRSIICFISCCSRLFLLKINITETTDVRNETATSANYDVILYIGLGIRFLYDLILFAGRKVIAVLPHYFISKLHPYLIQLHATF